MEVRCPLLRSLVDDVWPRWRDLFAVGFVASIDVWEHRSEMSAEGWEDSE
jgi:hypothetical protein